MFDDFLFFTREDLIKYYEELNREMEYREFRAQWIIHRRELNSTRVQFLAQEQAQLDTLKEQMTRASGSAQVPAKTTDVTDAQPGREVDEKPAPVSTETSTPASVLVPSPSLVSLIASGVRTDALVRAEQQNNAADLSVSTARADHFGVSSESQSAGDEELNMQATELSFEAGASDSTLRKTWDSPKESASQLSKLKEEGSGRKTWEIPEGGIKIASPLPESHPSDSSIQFAMYSDKPKSGDEAQTPGADTLKTSTPHVADSSLQNILYPGTPSMATSGLDAQVSGFVTQPLNLNAFDPVTSHPSDSSAQDILYGNSGTPASTEARTPSTQGHPSDSSAQNLMYSKEEGADTEVRISEHGHPSDSRIDNLLYPSTTDTPTPHSSRLSPHGHPSDSQVSLYGRDGLDAAQVMHHSSRSTWQHPSDASVQKLLGDISILGESQQTTRGTPPPSVAQVIIYPSLDAQSGAIVPHLRGTPPQSVAQDILYPKGEDSGQMLEAVRTRGGPPSSVIQDIMYPSKEGTVVEQTRVSTRGHEPEVKITKIMYYVKDSEGERYRDKPFNLQYKNTNALFVSFICAGYKGTIFWGSTTFL